MRRLQRIAEARAERMRQRAVSVLAEALPGAAVRIEGERVVAEGRGLRAAAIGSSALRWVAGALR
jgi:hypothetical protein